MDLRLSPRDDATEFDHGGDALKGTAVVTGLECVQRGWEVFIGGVVLRLPPGVALKRGDILVGKQP